MQLGKVGAYTKAFALSNDVWKIVARWNFFAKKTLGSQFVRSVDSISANVAEGFGRYHKKDKIKFYRYAQGSVQESLDWNQKAFVRGLLEQKEYEQILCVLKELPREVNALIKYTNEKLTI